MKPIKLTLLALYIGYIINIAFAFDFNPSNVTFAVWCMSAIISITMPLTFYVLGMVEREENSYGS
ncbi:hypothetical protein TW1_060 [Pseudoalteromonas phage TW1]|uniref:hypothetical protein n=1 Tax=Pseudoalteromonas phage TW1 TaxID=1366055 RepID=UPI00035AB908|nr:hypothetical protein PP585_gp60 [Pseudoalteromonas phage TW1]AGR46576.1 hypothetical protein TW1_060 [Pseudoalteromonas phage TW1]